MSHEGQIKILWKIEIEAAYPSVAQQAYALLSSLFSTSSGGKLQRNNEITKLRRTPNLGSKQVTKKNNFSSTRASPGAVFIVETLFTRSTLPRP